LREAIQKLPKDKIVLETDSPYLPPSPLRGKRNESSYIFYVAQVISELWKTSIETVLEQTKENALDLFPRLRVRRDHNSTAHSIENLT
ncbi:MAG: TatD family hydrolase, partial [Bacteroidia bacterium]|nr:TatD family hydrolase [Bacteroidia bacterium]